MSLRTTTDSQLVALLLQKNDSALKELIRRYEKGLLSFVNRKLNNKELSEEIVQDVFIELFEALRGFKMNASLKTYLFTIAKYKTIDSFRKKKIKKILFSAMPSYIVERLKVVLLDEELDKKELQEKIEGVFQKLPNDYRLIIRLKYIEEYKMREIAKMLSLSFKATESLLYRARRAFITLYNQS